MDIDIDIDIEIDIVIDIGIAIAIAIDIDFDKYINISIDKYFNICIDKYINICIDTINDIDINIDIDNFNTDASTVNSVHACFLNCHNKMFFLVHRFKTLLITKPPAAASPNLLGILYQLMMPSVMLR